MSLDLSTNDLFLGHQTLSTRYSVNKLPVRNPGSKNDVSKFERLAFGSFDVDLAGLSE